MIRMRKLYKFSHSVAQGGFLYAHKLSDGEIKDRDELRNALSVVSQKFQLIDVTIKIYDYIFFLFFMAKPSVRPIDLIDSIQQNIESFGPWNKDYIYSTMYDIQEDYLRNYLQKMGFDYDKG